VLSQDGEIYENPEALAEDLVIYMHDTVKEIFMYSRSALKALDAYFANHPPAEEYNNNFLWTSFIPALGAYLGTVLVAAFNGEWQLTSPLMKSAILINNKKVKPFQLGFEVVYEPKNLVDIYDTFS
jgi:hypothetical protein